jgi:hypothetical protein
MGLCSIPAALFFSPQLVFSLKSGCEQAELTLVRSVIQPLGPQTSIFLLEAPAIKEPLSLGT